MERLTIRSIIADCKLDPRISYLAFSTMEICVQDFLDDTSIPEDEFVSSREKVEENLKLISQLLPRSFSELIALLEVVLLVKSESPHYIYVFSDEGDHSSIKAGLPIQSLPSRFAGLPAELISLYEIHNGFHYELCEVGFLPTDKVEVFPGPEKKSDLLAVFQEAVNWLGFNFGSDVREAYFISVDSEAISPVEDFWKKADSLLFNALEQEG